MTAGIDTAAVAAQLACCGDHLDSADKRAQLALFRLLAEGEPVETGRLATHAGLGHSDLVEHLGRWHGVHTDDQLRVIAFQGLSVVEAPHRLRVNRRILYAWCAWDTLFLPELIGHSAEIESVCPTTGEAITLRVGPEGTADLSPPSAVLSFLLPGSRLGGDTIASFCSFIHFFASREAAAQWTAARPGTFVISIAEGFEIGRRTNAAQWGDALSRQRA